MVQSYSEKAINGLSWKFLEAFFDDIVSFVVSVILARLLTPDDYGEIALVHVFVVVANVFVVNGLGTALIQKKNADEIDYSSVFHINLLFSLVIYLILYWSSPYIANFYKIKHLSLVLRVLGLRIPLAAIKSIQNAILSRHLQFKKMFLTTSIGIIVSAGVGIYMAYMGYGVWALVVQILVNAIIGTIVQGIVIRWFPRLVISWIRLKALIEYGWKILASSLIKTGYDQLSSLLIGKLYSAESLAFYSKGKKYPGLVVTNIDTSISSVLFPIISKNQDNPETVKRMLRKSISVSSFIITPILLGLAAVGDQLIALILTEKWLPSVPFLRLCCFYSCFHPIHNANLQALRAIGRSDIVLNLDIIKRGTGILFLIVLMRKGVMGIALAPLAVSLLATIINVLPNYKLINYSLKEQFQDWLPNVFLSIFMSFVVWRIQILVFNYYLSRFLSLLSGVIIGIIIYILIAKITDNKNFDYIWNLIKNMINKKI